MKANIQRRVTKNLSGAKLGIIKPRIEFFWDPEDQCIIASK